MNAVHYGSGLNESLHPVAFRFKCERRASCSFCSPPFCVAGVGSFDKLLLVLEVNSWWYLIHQPLQQSFPIIIRLTLDRGCCLGAAGLFLRRPPPQRPLLFHVISPLCARTAWRSAFAITDCLLDCLID